MKRLFTLITTFAVVLSACSDCAPTEDTGAEPVDVDGVEEWLELRANPLTDADDAQPLLDLADGRELILLGESTHGTRQFYEWRADLTLRLAEDQGVDFVGIEGDWYAARAADRYVMGKENAESARQVVDQAFDRWPRWMWANEEFASFLEELREHNAANPDRPVRVYGIDMHGFFESLDRLLAILEEDHPQKVGEVQEHLNCLRRFSPQPARYAQAVGGGAAEGCDRDVAEAVEVVGDLYDGDDTRDLSARKHARVVASGEAQYRTQATGDNHEFWNVRAAHMFDAVEGMLEHHGDDARGVVWAHNTHVGDARATDMRDRGRINIGQISREKMDDDAVFALGFSTRTGDVIAGTQWESPHRTAQLPDPPDGSVDEKLARHGDSEYFVIFEEGDEALDFWADRPGQRAVGVVYLPERELQGNYVPTNSAERYDALIYLDETAALSPL